MQDFFSLGDEEKNTKLIQCIGKKIVTLTKQFDIVNIQTNYFTLAQLGLNHHLSELLACPQVLWMEGWTCSPPRAGLPRQTTCPIVHKSHYCFKSSLVSF